MVPIRALASLAAFLTLLAALPGCSALNGVFGGGFDLPPDMPSDFRFHLERQGSRPPEFDYLYQFARNGAVEYWVKAASPEARPNQGNFEISGNDVIALYDEVRASGLGSYSQDEEFVPEETGITFYVLSEGRERRLTFARDRVPPPLERLRSAVLTYVPQQFQNAEAPPDGPNGPPERFVGDSKTMIFYASDAEQLKDVPPERRVFFPTAYEALDHGYEPDPVSQPMKRVNGER